MATSAKNRAEVSKWKQAGFAELQEIFSKGSVPPLSELQGFYRGAGLALNQEFAPRPFTRAIDFFSSFWLSLWQGKKLTFQSEEESQGVNMILRKPFTLPILPFRTRPAHSLMDEKREVVQFDYNLPRNPFVVRGAKDEIVRIKEGLYLGLMVTKRGGKNLPLAFFALSSEEG